MKRRSFVVAGILIAASARCARATFDSLGWSPNGSTNYDGSGAWDTTTPNFSENGEYTAWDNSNPVPTFFGGTGGVVTVNGPIVATGGMEIGYPSPFTFQSGANGSLQLGGSSFTGGATLFNLPITGTGGLVINATATYYSDPGLPITFSGVNTYSGGTTVSCGTLVVAPGATLGDTASNLTVDASPKAQGSVVTVHIQGQLTLGSVVPPKISGQVVLVNPTSVLFLSSGVSANNMIGPGTLVKIGPGNLTASATHVSVASGTLFTGNSGTVAVAAGATAVLTGGSPFLQSSDPQSTVILAKTISFPGPQTFNGTLTGSGSVIVGSFDTLTLGGPITYTGATTVNSNASLVLGSSLTTSSSMSIMFNGQVAFTSGGNKVLETPSLDLTTSGVLDLSDNDMILPYLSTSPALTIRNLLKSAYNAGRWNGTGIRSTAANKTTNTALGYGEAADVGITSLDGQSITGNALIVKYTYYGDSSLDGKVDLGNDFNLFLQGFLGHGSTWELGDYNYDSHVDMSDFGMFIDGFKTQGGSLGSLDNFVVGTPLLSAAQKSSLLAAVPEPGMGIVSIAMTAAVLHRRRRLC